MNGIPFAFRSGFPSRRDAVVAGCRFDRQADSFESADELPNVLSHPPNTNTWRIPLPPHR
jgi:hypothetical protein